MDVTWVFRNYGVALFHGTLLTLALTLISIIGGTFFGLLLGLATSRHRLTSWAIIDLILLGLAEVVKALPVLLLIIWLNYSLPSIFLLTLSPFAVTCVALTLNLTVYFSQTFRGALEAVPQLEIEAGLALGMSRRQMFRRVLIPTALHYSFPGIFILYLNTLKLSTLGSVVAVPELLHTADVIILDRYRALEVYSALFIIYLSIILPLSITAHILEKRLSARR